MFLLQSIQNFIISLVSNKLQYWFQEYEQCSTKNLCLSNSTLFGAEVSNSKIEDFAIKYSVKKTRDQIIYSETSFPEYDCQHFLLDMLWIIKGLLIIC